ncbi:MAG: Fpg/Nei family DNA glycosylase [Chitinophagaceae bacterium]|nr:Fpg/Nei family DNA glycosylase [Chitinophagaceae bacterium]
MPELPDLEVFSANLTRALAGRKVIAVAVNKRAKSNMSAAKLKQVLTGQTLKKVIREGKELCFVFGKIKLGLHLMLRGKLYWLENGEEKPHTLFKLSFSNKKELGLTDFQYQAKLTFDPESSEVADAMTITTKALQQKLQSKATIKNLLLDQHKIRGIGNAYADEILWDASISPFSISQKIPAAKVKALATSIKRVLKNAQKEIRKADPQIIGGELRDFLVVHNSKKLKTPTGATIKKADTGGRRTYYSNEQELYK